MITKVRLANWRSHLNSELNFSTGTNALLGHMGSGKSLPYNELIIVKEDIWKKRKIGDVVEAALKESKNVIKNGDTTLTKDNPNNICVQSFNPTTYKIEIKPINAFIKHKSPSTLIKLKTRTGRTITITKNHSILIATKKGILPIEGQEIKAGDYLISAKKLNFDTNIEKMDISGILFDFRNTTQILRGLKIADAGVSYSKASRIVDIKQPHVLENWNRRNVRIDPEIFIGRSLNIRIPKEIELSKEFIRLAGAYVSGGYKDISSIRITNNDPLLIKEIQKCIKKSFPSVHFHLLNNTLQINGKIISTLFSRLFGSVAENKFVPDIFYNLKDDTLADFLMMCFEGDGWIYPEKEIACSSKSIQLIDGIMTLLSKWAIMSTIRKRKIKGEYYYDLNILPKHIPEFASYITFLNREKQEKLTKISKIIKNRKKWDGIDVIPNFFIKNLLQSLIFDYHLLSRKNPKLYALRGQLYTYMKSENIGREKLRKVLQLIYEIHKTKSDSFQVLEKIVEGDIFFDRVVEVEEISCDSGWVYDISIDGVENFVAGIGNLIVHNSTALDGICFALFGTFPTLQTKKLKLDDILMKKPVEKDRAEVEVQFQSDGKTYSVKRTIEKKKGTVYSEIREDGKLLEAPNASRVTEIVEKILKVNYELFSKAIYSEQNALDYFLTIPKGQRMKKIDELLMIDRFEKARANTVSLTNKIVERKLGKQSIVEHVDIEELEKTIGELKTALEKTSSEKTLLEKMLSEIIAEKQTLEREVSNLQKVKENLEILKREEKGIFSAIQETSFALESLEKNLKNVDKESIEKNLNLFSKLIKELEDLLIEKQKEYQKLQEQTSRAKAEVELLKKERIDRLEKDVEEKLRIKREFDRIKKGLSKDVEKDLEEKRLVLEKFVGEAEAIKFKIQDLVDILEQLSSVKAKCPICESKLTQSKKIVLIKQKKAQIEKLKEGLDKASRNKQLAERELKDLEIAANKLSQMVVEIRDLDKIKTELENSKNIYKVLNESAIKLEKELAIFRTELLDYQNRLKDSSDKKQQFEILSIQLRDYQAKKSRIEELIAQRNTFVKHIDDLEKAIAGRDLNRLELQLRNSLAKEKEITAKIFGIDQVVKEKEIRLKDFEQTLANAIKDKEEIKRLDKLIRELKVFEKALEQTQIELRREFVAAVNYTMNQLWQTLYPYQDFTGIKLAVEEGDYILQLQSRVGGWINVEGVASGGERSIACLALRIAFSLVLAPQLRVLILDEPTHNLDSTAVSVLATTLRERIQEFIDQTFLITHQPELEDAVTGNAYRLERDKRRDEVTRITRLS